MACCEICETIEAWDEQHDSCYACVHGVPCISAIESGEACSTVLDALAEL